MMNIKLSTFQWRNLSKCKFRFNVLSSLNIERNDRIQSNICKDHFNNWNFLKTLVEINLGSYFGKFIE